MSGWLAAAIAGTVGIVTAFGGRWLERRWRGPSDREQWDRERTGWMKDLSDRLKATEDTLNATRAALGTIEGKLEVAEDKLQQCELDKLDQQREIDLLRARIADLERRNVKAGEVLAPRDDAAKS